MLFGLGLAALKNLGRLGLGAALGGFGGSQSQKGLESRTAETQKRTDIMEQAIEPEYFTQFRQGLIDMMLRNMAGIQIPTAEAQKALLIAQQQQLTEDAIRAARQALARMGRLDSGAADTTMSTILAQSAAKQAELLTQMPMLIEQQRQAAMLPWLQVGASWTGAAPISKHTTGIEDITERMRREYQNSGGMPWWRSALSGLGGMIGADWILNRRSQAAPTQSGGQG